MKILFVPAAYFPALGGTERTTRMVAETLAARGHSISVAVADISSFSGYYNLVAPRTGRALSEKLNGVDIFRLKLYSKWITLQAAVSAKIKPQILSSATMKMLKYVSRKNFRHQLEALVDRIKPDIILTLPHLQPNVRIAADVAKSKNLLFGLFPHIHSHDLYFPHEDLSAICRTADVCIGITEKECDLLIKDYNVTPKKVIYSGLGTVLPDMGGVSCDRKEFCDILFVGRKTASKGLLLLEKAIRALKDTHDFRVVLVGAQAPDTASLEAEFRESLGGSRLVSEDNVSDAELDHWYTQSRLVVLPSKIESFGSVILEAWSHRRPIVTLDLPVFREIVSDNIDGLLVPADDPLALSKAISELLADEVKSCQMGQAGYKKVVERYTWNSVVDRIENKLIEIAEGRSIQQSSNKSYK